jgi:ketosteroid isomerase-like protein
MKPLRSLTVIALAAMGSACAEQPAADVTQAGTTMEAASVRAEIDQINRNIERWIAAGQVDSVAAAYTADGWAQGPNSLPRMGRDSIRAMWAALASGGGLRLTPRADEVVVFGNYAAERGTYEMTYTRPRNATRDMPPSFTDKGGYIVLWEKQGDQWLLKWDLGSSQMPMPTP